MLQRLANRAGLRPYGMIEIGQRVVDQGLVQHPAQRQNEHEGERDELEFGNRSQRQHDEYHFRQGHGRSILPYPPPAVELP